MSSKLKAPPLFDSEAGSYERWKEDLAIWQMLSDLTRPKQAQYLYLSLKGKAKEALGDIKAVDLQENEEGVKYITDKLDQVFLKDENTRAFYAFQEFYDYRRGDGDSYETFIVKFEQLQAKLNEYKMVLPDGVKAFFILRAANISEENDRLVRTTAGALSYEEVKDKIKKIFGNFSGDDELEPPVKEEVMYNTSYNTQNNNRGYFRGRGSSRGRSSSRGRGGYGNRSNRHPASSTPSNSVVAAAAADDGPKCHLCSKTDHKVMQCPWRGAFNAQLNNSLMASAEIGETDDTHNVHIILMNSKADNKQLNLVQESLGKGLLDCGCVKTVAGEVWIIEFLNTLPRSEMDKIKHSASKAKFRFGDSVEVDSVKELVIPVVIAGVHRVMKVDVVQCEIPLLIGVQTMKRMGLILNCENDTANVFGKTIELNCTTSGHYCLPVNSFHIGYSYINVVLHASSLTDLPKQEKMKKALKLHRQFGHANAEKLNKLFSHSQYADKEFEECIKAVCEQCEFCEKYKMGPIKPIVSLPRADKFNQLVAMDLKEFKYKSKKHWILHLIDIASRYSVGRLINNKCKETITKMIFEMWIGYFGRPKKFMTDNGGEFSNELMKELSNLLGVEVTASPAEAPFSNGVVERHNKILFETMMKTMNDTKCGANVALAWACSAKNALDNHHGYCPNTFVFGQNVNYPSVLTDEPPALSHTSSSDMIEKTINTIHSARENFIKAENSSRICKALKSKIRSYNDVPVIIGEKVWFKRRNRKGWQGPGRVSAFDGVSVWVSFNGQVYNCHKCHIMKKSSNYFEHDKKKATRRQKSSKSKHVKKPKDTASAIQSETESMTSSSDDDKEEVDIPEDEGDESDEEIGEVQEDLDIPQNEFGNAQDVIAVQNIIADANENEGAGLDEFIGGLNQILNNIVPAESNTDDIGVPESQLEQPADNDIADDMFDLLSENDSQDDEFADASAELPLPDEEDGLENHSGKDANNIYLTLQTNEKNNLM